MEIRRSHLCDFFLKHFPTRYCVVNKIYQQQQQQKCICSFILNVDHIILDICKLHSCLWFKISLTCFTLLMLDHRDVYWTGGPLIITLWFNI